ncbi:MAG TPA: PKD domain-containing protein, partial [Isosphaeraceae bacterium]
MSPRHRPLSAGPSTRRHRRASRRVALALEWLEGRWVPSVVGPLPGGVAATAIIVTQPPTIDGITNNGPVPAGTPVTLTVAAHNPQGLTGPLTYAFDFRDDGHFDVTNATGVASWTYDNPGLHVLDVRVIDSRGDKADALTFVIVTTPAPTVTPPGDQPAVEGTTTEFALGRFSQTGGTGPWNVTVDWGDETTSKFVATTAGDLGSQPHSYAKYGDYAVTVTVDDGRRSGSANFGAHVANAAPAVTAPADQSATEGSSSSFALGRFADIGAESPWIVTVDWGDGKPPTVFGAGAAGDLGSLPHTYATYGTYPVTVTVDDGQATGSATFHVGVADVAPTVTAASDQPATEGTTASLALGQFTDPGSDSPWLVTVNWGDLTPASAFASTSAGGLGSLPHDYAAFGTYVVTITVDDGRDTASATFLANVADVPPTVTVPADQTEALGTSTSFALGRFVDPGADLLWVATVDWGDNSPPTSVLMVSPGDLGSLAHEFPNIGSYTVTVTVADGRGSGSATFQATVSEATPSNPGNPGPPTNGPPSNPPPPAAAFFDPLSLLADVTSISVFLAVAPTGTGGTTTIAPGVTQVSTRVAQSFLSAAAALVIVDLPGPAPQGPGGGDQAVVAAAAAKAAGGSATASAVPVVVVEVALPANPFAPAPAITAPTTTTTTTTVARTAPGVGGV